jgi:hypothetical protein
MAAWLINDELKRTPKEEVLAQFEEPSRHLPGWTEENHEKPQIGQPGTSLKIWKRNFLNTKHEIQISDWKPAILTEAFRGFPQDRKEEQRKE